MIYKIEKAIKELMILRYTKPQLVTRYCESLQRLTRWYFSEKNLKKPAAKDWKLVWSCAYQSESPTLMDVMRQLHSDWIYMMKNYTQRAIVEEEFKEHFLMLEKAYGGG